MKKQCPCCGGPVVGRADKKFCSNTCRSAYNQQYHQAEKQHIKIINRQLEQNRRILRELNPIGKAVTSRHILRAKGFVFDFVTGVHFTRGGSTHFLVYEHAYQILQDHKVKLWVQSA